MSSRQSFLTVTAVSTLALIPAVANAAATGAAKLAVFYKIPPDQKAFEAYYFGTHVAKASKLPGLRSYIVSSSPITTPDGKPSTIYSFFAELTFDSAAALAAALKSEQGAATVADLKNFAQAGVDITIFDTKSV